MQRQMMKRFLVFGFSAFLCMTAGAQRITVKAGGGLSSHYGHTEAVGAFKISVGYEHEFNGNWSVEPAVAVYGKGWKDPRQTVYLRDWNGNLILDDEGNLRTGVKGCSSDAYYVSVPVVFNYYLQLRPMQYLVFTGGPYAAYGVGGKMKTQGDTDQSGSARYYYATRTFDEEGVHRFEVGLTAGLGYEFNSRFMIGVEADFGLTNFNAAGARNVSGLLTLGYRFRLDE